MLEKYSWERSKRFPRSFAQVFFNWRVRARSLAGMVQNLLTASFNPLLAVLGTLRLPHHTLRYSNEINWQVCQLEAENISTITEPTKATVEFVDGASKCGTIYKDKKARGGRERESYLHKAQDDLASGLSRRTFSCNLFRCG